MQIRLRYGSGTQALDLEPEHLIRSLDVPAPPEPGDPRDLVDHALAEPIASPPLDDLVKPGARVLLIVPDRTRRCGGDLFLARIVDRLNRLGVPDTHISLLFANGTHSAQTDADQRAIVSDAAFDRIPCRDHDCRDEAQLVDLGVTPAGTPVRVNRAVLDADLVLAVGTVNHHYFAGYGGGIKMLVPGVAAFDTALRNHALAIDPTTGDLHPGCRNGNLAGNPVYEDLAHAARLVNRPVFLLTTVLDADGRLVAAFAGDLFETNRSAGRFVDALYRVPIAAPADLVIASPGGYPKDIDVIQTHKTLQRAAEAVRPGGVIILLAECRHGIGSEQFAAWMRLDDAAFRDRAVHAYAQHAQTAASFRARVRKATVFIVTALPADLARSFGMRWAPSAADALAAARALLPPDFRACVIPAASLALPTLESSHG